MPVIPRFGGMITNPQSEDIPDFSSEWNLNVDPETQSQLKGVHDSGAAYQANGNVEIPNAYESVFIKYNASGTMKWDLVYIDKNGNDITVVEDFYNTEANRTFNDLVTSPNGTVSTIDIFGKEAQIGMGNGEGELPYTTYRLLNDRKFFNDNFTASAGVYAHYGICNNQDILFAVNQVTQTTPLQVNFTQVFGGGVVNHRMLKGDRIEIRGVLGATGANGIFTVSILSDTVVTLDGTVSGGAYTSGGTCYGGWCNITSVLLDGAGASGDYFQANKLYAWGISVVYDGLQESNLLKTYDSTLISDSNVSTSTKCTVSLGVPAVYAGRSMFADALFDKRVTAVNIYRAESSDLSPDNLGLYRLVRTIDINKGYGEVNWSAAGVFSYVDNGGYPGGGQTYEENSGISETVERTYVHYGLNTTGGGYHWMAQPYVPSTSTSGGVPTPVDWDRYIFRSQKYRPNMVNWVEGNHLVLPEIPIELKYYNNRLYAFTENRTYKINPELLIIEDDFEGAGVSIKGGVMVNEDGMFYCNLNGAYRMSGNRVTTISDNIKVSLGNFTSNNWKEFAKDALTTPAYLGRILVGYISDKRCIVFIGNDGQTSTTLAFVYYLPTKEWFTWDFGNGLLDVNSGLITGKDGELYWSGTTLNKLLGGTAYESAQWVSKEFSENKPSQNKLWRKLKWDGNAGLGTLLVQYATEGGTPIGATTAVNDSYINIYKKTLQTYLKTTGSGEFDSLDILVRELRGTR